MIPATREEMANVLCATRWGDRVRPGNAVSDDWLAVADLVKSWLAEARGQQPQKPSDGVRVRVAVAVDAYGEWAANGYHKWSDTEAIQANLDGWCAWQKPCRNVILTAIVPKPAAPAEIAATVEDAP